MMTERIEKAFLRAKELHRRGKKKRVAAAMAGISPTYFHELLKRDQLRESLIKYEKTGV